jgi:type IV pilus assembly protein PilM
MLQQKWNKNVVQSLFGVDISAHAIKVMKVNSSQTPFQVEKFSIVALPAGTIIKDEIKNPAQLVDTLKQAMLNIDGKIKNVAIAIPRASAIIKNINVDSRLTPLEIESRAWVEANRYFPDLVGEIYLDFDVIGQSVQDSTQLDLVLVACMKEQVKSYLDVLNESGLTAKVVDINCYAFERALLAISQPKLQGAIALLNLDFSLSSLIVMHDNAMTYAHDHSFEGQRLMTQVKQLLQDEGKKLIDPLEKSASLQDANFVKILKENLSSHLRHTMHFFYSSRPNLTIEKVLIGGDCSIIPGIAEFIQQEINIETAIANPFADMVFSEEVDVDLFKKTSSTLLLAYGLALSNMTYK